MIRARGYAAHERPERLHYAVGFRAVGVEAVAGAEMRERHAAQRGRILPLRDMAGGACRQTGRSKYQSAEVGEYLATGSRKPFQPTAEMGAERLPRVHIEQVPR